jgi:hypothetical protein
MQTQLMNTVYKADTAIFIDEDKTTINVFVEEHTRVEGFESEGITRTSQFIRTVMVGPNPIFEEFVKQVPLTIVEENTDVYNKRLVAQHEELEEQVTNKVMEKVAKRMGEMIPVESSTASSANLTEITQDDLFKLKLQAFEIDAVKNSKNREIKAKIRKSDNLIEVLAYSAAAILDVDTNTEAPTETPS